MSDSTKQLYIFLIRSKGVGIIKVWHIMGERVPQKIIWSATCCKVPRASVTVTISIKSAQSLYVSFDASCHEHWNCVINLRLQCFQTYVTSGLLSQALIIIIINRQLPNAAQGFFFRACTKRAYTFFRAWQ